jgi:hypothetical protein
MGIRLVAADIGSVGSSSKLAWAAFDASERQVRAAGTDPETAVLVLAPGCCLVPGRRWCWSTGGAKSLNPDGRTLVQRGEPPGTT